MCLRILASGGVVGIAVAVSDHTTAVIYIVDHLLVEEGTLLHGHLGHLNMDGACRIAHPNAAVVISGQAGNVIVAVIEVTVAGEILHHITLVGLGKIQAHEAILSTYPDSAIAGLNGTGGISQGGGG